ncbi:hypothetical protein DPMN_171399 [Dreissena polymorpha]|uniref:RING-type domain-containing protein n=1 Tax=Dreissena polymorpha TaxID=45954 RepID=A0A9D4IFJ1_DREPO|nr:hypothetical protein DPMN_171399 [Dreissena polymorpha]
MDGPAFRNRQGSTRNDYKLLTNESDSESSRRSSRHSSHQFVEQEAVRHLLCDKCWLKQERTRAAKRCLDCNHNLCVYCAKSEAASSSCWLPACIVLCLSCIFRSAFVSHSIVDLREHDLPPWIDAQEANRIQHIPRVSSSNVHSKHSFHSNDQGLHEDCNRRHCSDGGNRKQYKRTKSSERGKRAKEHSRFRQSTSLDERAKSRRHVNRISQIKSPNQQTVSNTYRHDDIERLRRYKENWSAFDEYQHQLDQNYAKQSGVQEKKQFYNKLKGKDIIIELSDNDAKVIVNEDYNSITIAGNHKKKSKCDAKTAVPPKYTEQVFEQVPIWFKKDSKQHTKDISVHKKPNVSHSESRGFDQRNVHAKPDPDPQVYNNYIVEEPPDQCSICLEDLPGDEARILECLHVFHTKCLIHMLRNAEMHFGVHCPVCARVTLIRNYYRPRDVWYQELPVSTAV